MIFLHNFSSHFANIFLIILSCVARERILNCQLLLFCQDENFSFSATFNYFYQMNYSKFGKIRSHCGPCNQVAQVMSMRISATS